VTVTPVAGHHINWAAQAQPTQSRHASLFGHIALVEALAAHVAPPGEWCQLKARLDTLQTAVHNTDEMLGRLTAAVVDGNGSDIAGLYVGACGEAALQQTDVVLGHVYDHAAARFHEIYAKAAPEAYRLLAAQFNAAAKGFTDATKVTDVTAGAGVIIKADSKSLKAWRDAENYAAALDSLVEPLAAAAILARRIDQPEAIGADPATLHIPLTVDTAGHHPRKLWHAWHQLSGDEHSGPVTLESFTPETRFEPGRCGRWARLAALHAKIRAVSDPAALQLFPPPRPYFVEFVSDGRGGRTQVRRDPESPTYQPPKKPDPAWQEAGTVA
jgi:hypothetical protein